MNDDIEIPKGREAQIEAIFVHLTYMRRSIDKMPKKYAPLWVKHFAVSILSGFGGLIIIAIGALIFIPQARALFTYLMN